MTAVRIDGKSLALKVRAEVAEDVRAFGQPVCLATILVGDDPASHVYVGSKHDASHEAGIDSRDHRFPSDTAESEILELIAELNADDAVDGILVQLPLPEHMDEPKVLRSVDPAKDVDGFHPSNAGLLFLGEPFLVPATPSGVMVMLAEHGVDLKGKEVVVIGRSEALQADGGAPRRARDRDDLPFADGGPRVPHTARGRPRGRGRQAGARYAGHGQAGRDRHRRRGQSHRGGEARR
jgi:hypothetical protein